MSHSKCGLIKFTVPFLFTRISQYLLQIIIDSYSTIYYKINISRMQSGSFKIVNLQKLQPVDKQYFSQELEGQRLWNENCRKKLLTYEETCKSTGRAMFDNGFFDAFYSAYRCHGDVKITPDDLWLVISIYFSKYVKQNSEELRSAFVSHQGKKTLTITTHNQLSENQWDQFFTLMIKEIKKNTTQGIVQKLQCDFTTTGRVQRIFSTAMVMNTCQNYFQYQRIIPLCGIQNIHFGGTLEDWKKVYKKTQNLAEFDTNGQLKRYVKNVLYIIQKFIETYEEKVDLDFWNKMVNIYYGEGGYGSVRQFSGWLMNLFGYEGWQQQILIDTLGFDIKIINQITQTIKMVRLVGGFKAVSREGRVFRPHLSMAILDDENPKSFE